MTRVTAHKRATSLFLAIALLLGFALYARLSALNSQAAGPPFKDWNGYVAWVQSHHKAPFDHDIAVSLSGKGTRAVAMPKGQPSTLKRSGGGAGNIKVNQDLNPWPKNELGAAVDPVTGKNYLVMANDFRGNWNHMYYHASADGGTTWRDDAMVTVSNFQGGAYSFQSDPGVGFDSVGNSVISTITGNLYFGSAEFNLDTEIDVAQGFANGSYTSIFPLTVDYQPCGFSFGPSGGGSCDAALDKPLLTVDNVPGSPNNGRVYVYYTLFCNGHPNPDGTFAPCTDGSASVPPFSSAILESHQDGAGLPFSSPALVSGTFTNEQFSSMVIDSHGTPHIFFDDFSGPFVMLESTLTGSGWVVNATPTATFHYNGLRNFSWSFRDLGTIAPGCGGHADTAYCAFSANQVGNAAASSTPDVYLATVNLNTGASHVSRVNNDPRNTGKDHFFPWASAAPNGAVYVGWYDNRNDPFSAKVQYFVGKSTDGGSSFPTQKPVSDAAFNPCNGFPGCGFFGDYTQIVTGPDGVTHATWTDTRDGASQQIFSQAISW